MDYVVLKEYIMEHQINQLLGWKLSPVVFRNLS